MQVEETIGTFQKAKDSPRKRATGKSFPEKVHDIIENPHNQNVIWWNKAGTAICIYPKNFQSQVLDKEFQGAKFDSFARRLTRYGFSRVTDDGMPPGTHVYYHDFFLRGQPELMEQMKGVRKLQSPPAKESITTREPEADAKYGISSSSDTSLKDFSRRGNLPINESAGLTPSEVFLLDQQLNTTATNDLNVQSLNLLKQTIEVPRHFLASGFNAPRIETTSFTGTDTQINQPLLSELLVRHNILQEQQLIQQQSIQIARELTERRSLLDFVMQRRLYQGPDLLPSDVTSLRDINPLLASPFSREQRLSSVISRYDQLGRPLTLQALQLQLLREKQRQDDLLRRARGNL
jgi:hypothetical protein